MNSLVEGVNGVGITQDMLDSLNEKKLFGNEEVTAKDISGEPQSGLGAVLAAGSSGSGSVGKLLLGSGDTAAPKVKTPDLSLSKILEESTRATQDIVASAVAPKAPVSEPQLPQGPKAEQPVRPPEGKGPFSGGNSVPSALSTTASASPVPGNSGSRGGSGPKIGGSGGKSGKSSLGGEFFAGGSGAGSASGRGSTGAQTSGGVAANIPLTASVAGAATTLSKPETSELSAVSVNIKPPTSKAIVRISPARLDGKGNESGKFVLVLEPGKVPTAQKITVDGKNLSIIAISPRRTPATLKTPKLVHPVLALAPVYQNGKKLFDGVATLGYKMGASYHTYVGGNGEYWPAANKRPYGFTIRAVKAVARGVASVP